MDPSALGSADHCNIGPDRRILSRRKGTDSREERGGLPLGRSGLYLVDRSISCLGLSADTWRIKYSGSRERASDRTRERTREKEQRACVPLARTNARFSRNAFGCFYLRPAELSRDGARISSEQVCHPINSEVATARPASRLIPDP